MIFLQVLAALWVAAGLYGVGLKWADYSKQYGRNMAGWHEVFAFLFMFLFGFIAVGHWAERNSALMRDKLAQSN